MNEREELARLLVSAENYTRNLDLHGGSAPITERCLAKMRADMRKAAQTLDALEGYERMIVEGCPHVAAVLAAWDAWETPECEVDVVTLSQFQRLNDAIEALRGMSK